MTADLELWLRGLWRHPNPCRHPHVVEAVDPMTGDLFFECRDCQQLARVSVQELMTARERRRRPVLCWGMA